MAMANPTVLLNGYLAEMIPRYFKNNNASYFSDTFPFFPVGPTTIDELTEQFPEGSFALYDRMLRFRRGPFPHIKREQLIYYFYKMSSDSYTDKPATDTIIETVQAVEDLLDRGDESAQEINAWIESKLDSNGLYTVANVSFKPIYFHDTQVFHLEEVRDIIDFGTARTYAGNKIILEYAYHAPDFNQKDILNNF